MAIHITRQGGDGSEKAEEHQRIQMRLGRCGLSVY
jgi:hypothetical protein